MNQNQSSLPDCSRRDFLKGGSAATLMSMLGGVELFAQNPAAAADTVSGAVRTKVAVIGIGKWGRELLEKLGTEDLSKVSDLVAVCDTAPRALRRAGTAAPGVAQTADYKTILANKDISAVIVATPTHQHKDIVLAAIQAGKHVYCEAPLAHTVEDAQAIALAAKPLKKQIFQAGLQLRSDPGRTALPPFIKSGALGQALMGRAQWHKKNAGAEVNWRWMKATSSGLIGEMGVHAIDQAIWFFRAKPRAVAGSGFLALYTDDGRDLPDTVQAVFDFPGGVTLSYDATLANSFDGEYQIFYGTFAALMLRENRAWMFKEVDSPLLGWEVYAAKETFYKETGIVLKVGHSKGATTTQEKSSSGAPKAEKTSVDYALENFLRNVADVNTTIESTRAAYGDDEGAILEEVGKLPRRAAAGWLEGFQATMVAIRANEAILSGQRVKFRPEWYELS